MRKILLVAIIMSLYSLNNVQAIELKSIKTEIGFRTTVLLSRWNNISSGLVEWPTSRYYQTKLNTKFNFRKGVLLNPFIKFTYKKVSISYEYLSNQLPGEISISDYKTDLKEIGGTYIHSLDGFSKKQKIRLSYTMKFLNLFVEGFRYSNSVAGCYRGTITTFNPLSGLYIAYRNKGIGFGLNKKTKLISKNLFIVYELFLAPLNRYFYTYQSPGGNYLNRKMWGWDGYLQTGIGYKLGNFSLRLIYPLEFSQTYDHSIKDKFSHLSLGISYAF